MFQRVYRVYILLPHGVTLPLAFLSAGTFLHYPYCYDRRAPDFKLCQIHACCASLCPTKLQRPQHPRCALSGIWIRGTFGGIQVPLEPPCDAPPAFYLCNKHSYFKCFFCLVCKRAPRLLESLGLNVRTTVAFWWAKYEKWMSGLVVSSTQSF